MGPLIIGAETPAHTAAVFALHAAAFPTEAEARLVAALSTGGRAVVSLVAEVDGLIAGHVLFSRVSVGTPSSVGAAGVGLAPLAVLPALQRRGIGARLVEAGLDACRRAGFGFAVVLGEPRYYRRFGFARARDRGLSNEYGMDDEFMVVELYAGGLAGIAGLVAYAPEFAAVAER